MLIFQRIQRFSDGFRFLAVVLASVPGHGLETGQSTKKCVRTGKWVIEIDDLAIKHGDFL
jgi:hypothetical protein